MEHPADRIDDRPVGIEDDFVAVVVGEPDRQPQLQGAARRRASLAADEPCPDPLQLELRHRALEAEKEPVIAVVGIVDPVLVEDQRAGDPRDPQQLMPVGVVARQPRDLQPEHEPHLARGDPGHEIAEAAPVRARGARFPLVLVDHADALGRPAQRHGPAAQPVLATRALGVLHHLAQGGLPDVQARLALQMMRLDLACGRPQT